MPRGRARSAGLQSGVVAAQSPTNGSAPETVAAVAPPRPDDCAHPSPVRGVMAREFSTYQGARGPEGVRRTSTYYGPVVGGLPISAWHCETCGLLRLTYVDGRSEERRLYPGPQPGLIARPAPFDERAETRGLQARVSGVTAPPTMYLELTAPFRRAAVTPVWQRVELPSWGVLTWLTVAGLVAVMVELLVLGILAVYTYSTPDAEGTLAVVTALTFVAVLAAQLFGAAQRHWFPFAPLPPSIAMAQRARPALDPATKTVVALLVVTMVGLFAISILATYTYWTSAAVLPVVVITVLCALGALAVGVGSAAARHLRGR